MPGALAVALLRLVLEDADLLAALVACDGGLDLDLLEIGAGEDDIVVAGEHHRAQVDLRPLVGLEPIDDEGRALLGAILLAADSIIA